MTIPSLIESLAKPDHPFWSWSKSVIVIVCVAVVLYHNASTFDQTEWKAIAEIAIVVFGATGVHNWLRAKGAKSGPD